MNTPLRWIEASGDAPAGAADLLCAAAPPPTFSDALRYRLAVGVAKTATLPVPPAWTSLLAKGALLASLGGASGFLVHAIANKHDVPLVMPAPALAAPSPAVAADAEKTPPVSIDTLPALQLPSAPAAPPRLQVDPRLEEAELLEKARALVGSSPSVALKLTAEHARDYPKGRLGAEADLIAAQSLRAMGKASAARQRAQASLSRYPNGLYARQLREISER